MVKAKRWCWREIDELARHLVRLMPVLRLRDARFMRRIHNGTVPHSAADRDHRPSAGFSLPRTGQPSAKFIGRSDPSGAIGHGATA